MADIFLRSTDGNDGNAGTQKEAAKATLAAALTAAGAGGRVFLSGIHAETQATAMTLTSPGTAASPVQVICVADWGAATGTGTPTTLATTGTISTTGNSIINYNGIAICYGVTFTAGNGANATRHIFGANSAAFFWVLDSCTLVKGGTTASTSAVTFGTGAISIVTGVKFINTKLQFAATGDSIHVRCNLFEWYGTATAIQGATIPTTLFITSTTFCVVRVQGVDLSALASGKTLFDLSGNNGMLIDMADCKLGASVAFTTGAIPAQESSALRAVNCDSADTNYRYYLQTYQGTITQETTIVRTGGASDGTTPISRKMVSTANAKFYSPLVSDWCEVWLNTTGSKTITIPVITDNVTLKDTEAWIEVEYLGTSSFPLGNFASDAAADLLATGANQTTDGTSTWTTTGLTTPVKQSLAATVTTTGKGLLRARVCLAKASTTMYFGPLLQVT